MPTYVVRLGIASMEVTVKDYVPGPIDNAAGMVPLGFTERAPAVGKPKQWLVN